MHGARARCDAELPPFISIFPCPGRPVMISIEYYNPGLSVCGAWISQTWLFQTWLFAIFTRKRSFALFCALCALLRTCVCAQSLFCAHLRAFARFCVRPRLERPRLGTADNRSNFSTLKAVIESFRSRALWAPNASYYYMMRSGPAPITNRMSATHLLAQRTLPY